MYVKCNSVRGVSRCLVKWPGSQKASDINMRCFYKQYCCTPVLNLTLPSIYSGSRQQIIEEANLFLWLSQEPC